MKAFLAAAFALAVSGVSAQVLVNTPPSAVVCQPLLITWSGGTPPYFLSILPGNQPGAAALVDFGNVGDATQQTWLVNLPPGTIGLNLRDSTGGLSQSAPFPIIAGTDDSCLNATTTTTSSRPTTSGTGTTTTTSRATTTTTSTTPTTSTTVTTPRPTTSATTTGTTPPTTGTSGGAAPLNTNAASKLSQAGFAGVAAAVAAVLLA